MKMNVLFPCNKHVEFNSTVNGKNWRGLPLYEPKLQKFSIFNEKVIGSWYSQTESLKWYQLQEVKIFNVFYGMRDALAFFIL